MEVGRRGSGRWGSCTACVRSAAVSPALLRSLPARLCASTRCTVLSVTCRVQVSQPPFMTHPPALPTQATTRCIPSWAWLAPLQARRPAWWRRPPACSVARPARTTAREVRPAGQEQGRAGQPPACPACLPWCICPPGVVPALCIYGRDWCSMQVWPTPHIYILPCPPLSQLAALPLLPRPRASRRPQTAPATAPPAPPRLQLRRGGARQTTAAAAAAGPTRAARRRRSPRSTWPA